MPERLCRVADIPDPGSRGFTLRHAHGGADIEMFVVRVGGVIRGYANRCPHTGVSLNWLPDQFLDAEGQLIQCAMHGALFRPESGECIRGPCLGECLAEVPLRIEQGTIYANPLTCSSEDGQ